MEAHRLIRQAGRRHADIMIAAGDEPWRDNAVVHSDLGDRFAGTCCALLASLGVVPGVVCGGGSSGSSSDAERVAVALMITVPWAPRWIVSSLTRIGGRESLNRGDRGDIVTDTTGVRTW